MWTAANTSGHFLDHQHKPQVLISLRVASHVLDSASQIYEMGMHLLSLLEQCCFLIGGLFHPLFASNRHSALLMFAYEDLQHISLFDVVQSAESTSLTSLDYDRFATV